MEVLLFIKMDTSTVMSFLVKYKGSNGDPGSQIETTHNVKVPINDANPIKPVLCNPTFLLNIGNAREPKIPIMAETPTRPPRTDSVTHCDIQNP